ITAARGEALTFLIFGLWYRQEARRLGIRVTRGGLAGAVGRAETRLPTGAARQRYLDAAGMTRGQFYARIRRDALVSELLQEGMFRASRVSREDVARFYAKHRSAFDAPRTRNLRVVVARSRAAAL